MTEPKSWRLLGGLNLETGQLSKARSPGSLIGSMNYEPRPEGYRRTSGYERYDGTLAPSDGGERDDILEVPGKGEVLGVWRYRNRTIAFRKDDDGNLAMHESSEQSWRKVEPGWKVGFDAGGTEPDIASRETLADAASSPTASAEVLSIHVESGTWSGGDAKGSMIVKFFGDGRFSDNDSLYGTGATAYATVDGEPEQVGLSALGDGPVSCCTFNFYGSSDRERMYFATDDPRYVFEYGGGNDLRRIDTGVPRSLTNRPVAICGHKDHLFVAYLKGSAISSAIGNPRSFDGFGGASEIAVGDEITGMIPGYLGTLTLIARNRTMVVRGSSSADWNLISVSVEAGGFPHTAQLLDEPVTLDDRGVRTLAATERYGDFSVGTVSDRVRPVLDSKREAGALPAASVRVKAKSQYRVFFDDGEGLVMALVRRGGQVWPEFSTLYYEIELDGVRQAAVMGPACSAEDSDGRERVFFAVKGSGHVYEMDKGDSFDGLPIQAYAQLPYTDLGYPGRVKRFRRVVLEVDSPRETKFKASANFADGELATGKAQEFKARGPNAIWDRYQWNGFEWDTSPVRTASARVPGRGRNMSLLLFSSSNGIPPHTLTGVTLHFDMGKVR